VWGELRDNYRHHVFMVTNKLTRRSQLLRVLRLRSAAARLLGLWVRIPPGAWIFVCRECRVLSGRGLCDELITRPDESYRFCCVVVCDLEYLVNEEAMTHWGLLSQKEKNKRTQTPTKFTCNIQNSYTFQHQNDIFRGCGVLRFPSTNTTFLVLQ
jgi:hypothetical protein